MSHLNNKQQNQLERERIAAARQAKSARMVEAMTATILAAADHNSDDDDEVMVVKKEKSNTTKTKTSTPERGRMDFKHGNVSHFINGRKTTAEAAYNTYNWAAYIAGAVTMYHTAIGETTNINLEAFSAILTNAFMIYGPKQSVELSAVSACMEHINDNDVDAFEAMNKASRAIRNNGPARVYSDAVITGKTGMIADLSTGEIVVPQEKGLSIRATQSLASLLVATAPKPYVAMEEIIADLGHYDTHLAPVNDYLAKIEESADECPEIIENNSFRRLSKVPGTMSTDIKVRSKHGVYQAAYSCLEQYHEEAIDLVVVPEYTLGMTGLYDSLGTASRVIPLPKSAEHYSLTLFSTVENYEDGLRSLLKLEEERRLDPEIRKESGSARSALHAPYAAYYHAMRTEPQGRTPLNLRYVRMADEAYVGTKELLFGAQEGKYDHSPALVRVSDYFQAQVKSLEGYCIIIDLPMMVGVYVSPAYVTNYFKASLIDRSGRPKCTDGFYVLKPGPKGTEIHYSAWIEKYIFAHISGSLMGSEIKETILDHYMKGYREERKGNTVVASIIRDLRICYDKQIPTLSKIVVITPGYSAHKAFKYRTIMCDFDAIPDVEYQTAVKAAEGGGEKPPAPPEVEVVAATPPPDDFGDWTYDADEDDQGAGGS